MKPLFGQSFAARQDIVRPPANHIFSTSTVSRTSGQFSLWGTQDTDEDSPSGLFVPEWEKSFDCLA